MRAFAFIRKHRLIVVRNVEIQMKKKKVYAAVDCYCVLFECGYKERKRSRSSRVYLTTSCKKNTTTTNMYTRSTIHRLHNVSSVSVSAWTCLFLSSCDCVMWRVRGTMKIKSIRFAHRHSTAQRTHNRDASSEDASDRETEKKYHHW